MPVEKKEFLIWVQHLILGPLRSPVLNTSKHPALMENSHTGRIGYIQNYSTSMNKKFQFLIFVLCLGISNAFCQTQKTTKINFLNPGIAWERPLGKKTTTELNIGVGYNASYPELTDFGVSGFQALIAPFLDIQSRYYYNFLKRATKLKSIEGNSANFVAFRGLYTGQRIAGNVYYNENYAISVGPTWGFQRKKANFNTLFSIGPVYYFDLTGTGNWLPLFFELNLGFHLKKK